MTDCHAVTETVPRSIMSRSTAELWRKVPANGATKIVPVRTSSDDAMAFHPRNARALSPGAREISETPGSSVMNEPPWTTMTSIAQPSALLKTTSGYDSSTQGFESVFVSVMPIPRWPVAPSGSPTVIDTCSPVHQFSPASWKASERSAQPKGVDVGTGASGGVAAPATARTLCV